MTVEVYEKDIGLPTKRFMAFVDGLEGSSFLNRFTMGEFRRQVIRRFVRGQK